MHSKVWRNSAGLRGAFSHELSSLSFSLVVLGSIFRGSMRNGGAENSTCGRAKRDGRENSDAANDIGVKKNPEAPEAPLKPDCPPPVDGVASPDCVPAAPVVAGPGPSRSSWSRPSSSRSRPSRSSWSRPSSSRSRPGSGSIPRSRSISRRNDATFSRSYGDAIWTPSFSDWADGARRSRR